MTTEDKERIEKEADVEALLQYDYASAYGGYIAGATFENERAQQELQAYRDIIKELIPIAERMQTACESGELFDYSNEYDFRSSQEYQKTITKARKLIDTVTPT